MTENRIPEQLTISWLQQAYASGIVTPEEVLREICRRAGRLEKKHIWITPPSMSWIQAYFDHLPVRDAGKYPLWGIPFAIKDNIDLAGIPTTAACPAYAYTPDDSATVVKKLIAAGAIPVGKTNLDQFATGLVGTRSPYGEVENAYVPERISGGSSSGSAVSVASGLAAFALGTDTAGSGRVPAMLNNLIGYKPPLGAWSTKGVVPACAGLDCVTVFTHSLDEARLIDRIARGFDEDCCWSRNILHLPDAMPRVILLPQDEPEFFGDFAEDFRKKWNEAVSRLNHLGAAVLYVDTTLFQRAARLLYEGAFVAERWADLGDFVQNHPNEVFPVTRKILESGGRAEYTAARLFADWHELQTYRHQSAVMMEHAVLVLPTAGGTYTREQVRKDPVRTNSKMGLYTNHCNLLDLAAIAVPQDSVDRKDPFGITFFSLHHEEHLLCAAAEAFLKAEPAAEGKHIGGNKS